MQKCNLTFRCFLFCISNTFQLHSQKVKQFSKTQQTSAFEKKIIKCFIDKKYRTFIHVEGKQPQSICVEVIEKFEEELWKDKKTYIFETLTCNLYESLYI